MSVSVLLLHPGHVQTTNLVPALQEALQSLHQSTAGTMERALLASPVVLGLLSWATQLLEQSAAAAALGPEAPLLVLEALSHLGSAASGPATGSMLGSSDATRQVQHCRRLWRHAHASLGDAADVAGIWTLASADVMSPDMIVRYYEACARAATLAVTPSKSRGLGLLLKSHLRQRRFTTDESVRLLAAWSQLRRRMPFNVDSYNFAELAASLESDVAQLTGPQLQAVASSAPCFPWPVYRSMPLLRAVCREALLRSLAGSLPLPIAQRTLSAAVRGVGAVHPRLAHDLQAATCEWMRDAPPSMAHAPEHAPLAADCCGGNNAVPCPSASLAPLAGTSS